MRILVTGGAGFIGSHLCERLVGEGHEVLCLDNFYTGSRLNIAPLLTHPRFELIRHDVIEPILLEVERIYHLACPASPVHYQANPIKTIKTGVLGTLNMLGLAKRVRARLLLASTSEVYGDPLVHPQHEEYWGHVNPIGVRSCYDESKRLAETLTMDYHRQNGVDTRIIRIFNTYGPRMSEHDGRVVSNLIVQALQGEALSVYGNGEQTRSFCYVSDLVEGMVGLMESDYTHPVNLGNPGEYTINELADLVRKLINPGLPIVYRPLPSDDPRQRRPDISLARRLLGWQPQVELREGLLLTAEDFAKRLGRGVRPSLIAVP
ncbi:UDP-glucuronic acid decarboxylase family protein [Gloeobacter violaceus]|uniref:UDP-glucuronate decarboxylase n=1 Tax=Gloeobacter violaceus (strain ATCC 29082 / PCC 7421) TaxID=251221 RepID=Q7NIK4_GLOVI|nr:UDP-glucuronic acid decarboxylase family protein [Gloeobacter violaceus]BAC90120.1 dTDP-glucose 4-6-dehydratase [Gloeobacter violaceus PCC 7421]